MKNAYKFAIALLACAGAYGQSTVTNSYSQINLVSDGTVSGTLTDTHLKNPWGLSRSAGSYWWASDANTGVSTLYNGNPPGQIESLVVTVPTATGTGTGSPTGTVADGSSFVFVTLDGTISQWTTGTKAVIKVNNHSKGAVYTGLTMATNGTVKTLYAANTVGGIETYNASTFAPITLGTGAFVYPSLPSGYTPYGIQAVGTLIFVTYTSGPGTGNGAVGAFTTAGVFKAKLARGSFMNEPWGIAKAPSNFGAFSGDTLVGMTGSGQIAAFNSMGQFQGVLKNSSNQPIANPGLWAIYFGGGGTLNGPTNFLYFNAGINNMVDGLFGYFMSND